LRFWVVLLVITGLLLTGCQRIMPPGGTTVEDYLPLKIGNHWSYEGEGTEYASYDDWVLYREGNRVQVKRDNGGTVLALVYEVKRDRINLVYVEEEAYDDQNRLKKTENESQTILMAPLKMGTKWIAGDRKYEVVEEGVQLTTPAGTFKDVVRVRSTFGGSPSEVDQYYGKGVGLVFTEFRSPPDTRITSSLKTYERKK